MENKIFFLPGDVVTVKQSIPNSPTMLVLKKVQSSVTMKGVKNTFFQGILCRWFTTEGLLQEAVFNTKDLIKVYGS
jgi:uncharacterized protein YodC (DUF2158 family)